jgi:hypothetical protein
MLVQNDAGACLALNYACFALFTHPHAVEQRIYFPQIARRCPYVFGAVKELLACFPGDVKHNLILPRQVICTFGFVSAFQPSFSVKKTLTATTRTPSENATSRLLKKSIYEAFSL